jgi:hypothetical protein
MTSQGPDRRTGTPRTVHFEIDRLTLHGYSSAQRARFVDALQGYLTGPSTVDSAAWPPGGQHRLAHLDAGMMRVGATPEEAARHVGAALLGHLAVPRSRHA